MSGDCTRQHPYTALLGGPFADGQLSLVFTPQFPCGVEIDGAGNARPLITLPSWSGCVGEPDWCCVRCRQPEHECACADGYCPPHVPDSGQGRKVLVSGHVQGLQHLHDPATLPIEARAIDSCDGVTSEPRVKLAVEACGITGPTIIDSDSYVVMPAGILSIRVLGPASWFGFGLINPPQPPGQQTNVTLRITACPLDCCFCPPGVLTEWLRFDAGDDQASRTLIRPRRARRLAIAGVNAAGLPTNIIAQFWIGNPNIGGVLAGAHTFQGGFPITMDPFGAATHIVLLGPAPGVATAYIRWEIE